MMTDKTATTGTTTTTAAAAAPAAPKKVGGFLLTQKISFGVDGEKKPYNGTDNNPKRKGTKSFELFAKYRDGMTVEEATKAGITGAALSWDSRHNFIRIA